MRCLSVIAPDPSTGFYYPGFVEQSLQDAKTTVWFYCRVPLNVKSDQIIVIGGAVPCPRLHVWDHTLVRVYCKTLDESAYIPARVVVMPEVKPYSTKLFTLQLYTGTLVHKQRRYIVKISNYRYQVAVNTILNIRHRRPVEFQSNGRSGSLVRKRADRPPLIYMAEPRSIPCLQTSISVTDIWRIYPIKHKKANTRRSHTNLRSPSVHGYTGKKSGSVKPSSPSSTCTVSSTTSNKASSKASSKTSSKASTISRPIAETPPPVDVENPQNVQPVTRQSDPSVTDPTKGTVTKSSSISDANQSPQSRNIEVGQEILARWPDDGWYYFGVVVMEIDDDKYVVRDSTGHIETVNGDDVFTESQNQFQVIEPTDHVIGLHPSFLYSYAPATVREVYSLGVRVQFFDRTEASLPFCEVYKLAKGKYKMDLDYIRHCEDSMCGDTVVARDDSTGLYIRCAAECSTGRNEFIIRLPNGVLKNQSAVHVFDKSPRLAQYPEPKDRWLHVLAPWDELGSVFCPATIVHSQPLRVQFADKSQKDLDTLKHCFYLNEVYYTNAVNFYIDKSSRQPS